MGFVHTGNGDDTPATVTNNGFYPAIDLEDFRAVIRADKTVTNARLSPVIVNAIVAVNRELADFRARNIAYATLAEVPADQVNGRSVLTSLYLRAIYCLAKAELMERYPDFDATNTGEARAHDMGADDDYRRDARWAISDLLGLRRSTIELI